MVNSSGIAFHSHFMQSVKETMLKHMKTVLPSAKPRSARWISTSLPEHKWESDLAASCSADYQVNNAMSPVLFYEGLQKIPENAVAIEIAPHCLLQAILRRSLHSSCTNIGLMSAKSDDNLEYFLQALGKTYQAGISVAFQRLYPRVSFPVPRGTPMISPLIKWDHSVNWPVINAKDVLVMGAGGAAASTSFTFDPFAPDSKDKYLLDHIIDGRVLFPFTGHLIMVWKAICKLRGLDYLKTQVIMEEVSVYRPTIVTKPVKFDVVILPGTGKFTVLDGDALAASGTITIVEEQRPFFFDEIDKYPPNLTCERIELHTEDVYKEFLLRGYEYGSNFRGIFKACNSGDRGLP